MVIFIILRLVTNLTNHGPLHINLVEKWSWVIHRKLFLKTNCGHRLQWGLRSRNSLTIMPQAVKLGAGIESNAVTNTYKLLVNNIFHTITQNNGSGNACSYNSLTPALTYMEVGLESVINFYTGKQLTYMYMYV